MRRLCDRRAVAVLVAALPSFLACYDELRASFGEELTCEMVFSELASEAADLLDRVRRDADEHRLEELFAALEEVARAPGVDGASVVGRHFLGALDERARRLADSYLGRQSAELAARLSRSEEWEREEPPLSRAAPPPVRLRPKRYSGRAPRRRRRP